MIDAIRILNHPASLTRVTGPGIKSLAKSTSLESYLCQFNALPSTSKPLSTRYACPLQRARQFPHLPIPPSSTPYAPIPTLPIFTSLSFPWPNHHPFILSPHLPCPIPRPSTISLSNSPTNRPPNSPSFTLKMPALNLALIPRDTNLLIKRINNDNWAGHNPGVVLVFCIVFIVAVGLISLFVYRRLLARRAARVGR